MQLTNDFGTFFDNDDATMAFNCRIYQKHRDDSVVFACNFLPSPLKNSEPDRSAIYIDDGTNHVRLELTLDALLDLYKAIDAELVSMAKLAKEKADDD